MNLLTDPTTVILLTACLVTVASSLLGVFVVLRRQSMMSDAISHAILPGIVAAFWLTGGETATLPALIGAAVMGLLTVVSVEVLTNSRLVKSDAAIGAVFPLLFSLGVILISLYFRGVHLDLDAVLYGEIAYAPLNRVGLMGMSVPESLLLMGSLAIINAVFVGLFYKELKLSTFDAGLAASLGFAPVTLNYALMTLLSLTTVGAFQSVGAVLIVAFVIIPPATAYLLTTRLSRMLGLSILVGVLGSVAGYALAHATDTSIAGCMAGVLGALFVLALLFSPNGGILQKVLRRRRQGRNFAARQLVTAREELQRVGAQATASALAKQLGWSETQVRRVLQRLP